MCVHMCVCNLCRCWFNLKEKNPQVKVVLADPEVQFMYVCVHAEGFFVGASSGLNVAAAVKVINSYVNSIVQN